MTDDPNGTVGVTIAGYNGNNEGVIQHYEIPTSQGALAVGAGSWPMFHHDPDLSGAATVLPATGTVTPAGLTAQAGTAEILAVLVGSGRARGAGSRLQPVRGDAAGPDDGGADQREHAYRGN